jgi:hypothetical protein
MSNIPAERIAFACVLMALCLVIEVSSSPRAVGAGPSNGQAEDSPCVLLRNENVLFGVARQVGQFVIVETGQGGEIQLPRQEVLCWADSLRHLYRYRVDHRQSGDLSALLRDARWCLRYDLFDLAAKEIRGVWAIDPNNTEAGRIEDQLRRQSSAARRRAAVGPASGQSPSSRSAASQSAASGLDPAFTSVDDTGRSESPGPIKIVAYSGPRVPGEPSEPGEPGPVAKLVSDSLPDDGLEADIEQTPVDVDLPTLRRFASQVQPMLLNRCGRCHDAAIGNRGGWKIELPPIGARSSARMTRENLSSALRYIDPLDPEQSLLLSKATTAHGGGESPLQVRDAKAIEALRRWLWIAAASIGSMEPVGGELESMEITEQVFSEEMPQDRSGSMPAGPSRLPRVANPFDPDLFNRRFHLDASAGG